MIRICGILFAQSSCVSLCGAIFVFLKRDMCSMGFIEHLDASRSHREHGLYERAMACGAALPCPISWVTIPVRDSVDDPSYQLVEWPVLLPKDFVSRLDFGLGIQVQSSTSFN